MNNPFDEFDAQQGNPFDEFDEKPALNAAEDPSIAADVAKGALSGVGRGIAEIPGVYGDVQQLARMAPWAPKRSLLDAILEKTTGSKNLPTSDETVKFAGKFVPGLDYKPETTAGRFAQRAGEFATNAIGGEGSLAARTARYVALPALGSQAAEYAAEGTGLEPVASALGAIAGGTAGGVVRWPGQAARAAGYQRGLLPQDAKVSRSVDTLTNAGVKLSAGDMTGSDRLRWMEDAAGKMAGARDVMGEKQASLNKAMFKQAGVDNFLDAETSQFTPETWLHGDARFKQAYDDLNSQSFVDYNPTFNAKLGRIETDYHDWTNATGRVKGVSDWFDKVRDIAVNGKGKLSGTDAQQWRSELVRVRKSLDRNSSEFKAIDGLVKLFDDSLEANTPQQFQGIRKRINREYSNYKLLEEAAAGAGSTSGFVSPALVRGKAARRNNYAYQRGTSDLGELAKAAEQVMKAKPSSGTAERAMNSGAIGGAIGIPTMATGAALGRILTSDIIQKWLGGGYRPARQARAATPINRDAIMRAGIMGLLSGGTQ